MADNKKESWESRHPSWPFPEPRIARLSPASAPSRGLLDHFLAEAERAGVTHLKIPVEAPAAQDAFDTWWASSGLVKYQDTAHAAWEAALAYFAGITPAAQDEREALTTCNCRWRGEELVQQCELHEAWHVAIHEWAERAKAAEALLAARAPQAAVSGAADPVSSDAGEQTGPVSAAPTPQPIAQAEAVQTLRQRLREEFHLVAGLGRSACINSAMLHVDALIAAISAPPAGEPVAHTALKQVQQHLRATSYHPVKNRIFEIVDQYFDGAPSAPAGELASMPPLTDAMRAVIRNDRDVYGDEDALYAALCEAAGAAPAPQPEAAEPVPASVQPVARWIPVADSLPEQRERPYQVVAVCTKRYGSKTAYPGEGVRGVYQDWVIRQWPQNFVLWMPLPEAPAALAQAGDKEQQP